MVTISTTTNERGKQSALKAHKRNHFYRIESETLTVEQIAQRLNTTKDSVWYHMRMMRGASGAITWERLRSKVQVLA